MENKNRIMCPVHKRWEIISYYYILANTSITYYTPSCMMNIYKDIMTYIEPTWTVVKDIWQ